MKTLIFTPMGYKFDFFKSVFSALFLITAMLVPSRSSAAEVPVERDFLQKAATMEQVRSYLKSPEDWVPYPNYRDRNGWEKLIGEGKSSILAKAEKNLAYAWQVVPASAYLEFEKSGDRNVMQNPYNANLEVLSNLMLAELVEGKGRFMSKIIDGIWAVCDMESWVLSAHLPSQESKRSLPDPSEEIIDLGSGDVGSLLSWAYYFFHVDWDQVDPVISRRVKSNIQQRILTPYLERDDFWWMALDPNSNRVVNNWNPWCNFNVLSAFLLIEKDPEILAQAVYKSMVSVDKFINYVKADGACEEGPSYWGHAAGKMYDYLQLLSDATGAQISIFDQPQVKAMGEYIWRSFIGEGWVVNFADASAQYHGEPGLIYRYGAAVGSKEMEEFAGHLFQLEGGKIPVPAGRDFFRILESLVSNISLEKLSGENVFASATWYPETEVAYLTNSEGMFFAAKGGFNNESHNHNDAGSFILYYKNTPFLIDAGVGTYTRQTFSNERYSIWTMQSNYHNLPEINGAQQKPGAAFKATKVSFDPSKNIFAMNLEEAYGKEAEMNYWRREFRLGKGELELRDRFQLNAWKVETREHFLTWEKPVVQKPGLIALEREGKILYIHYPAEKYGIKIEAIPQEDPRLSHVWGKEIYRLSLELKEQKLKNESLIRFSVKP